MFWGGMIMLIGLGVGAMISPPLIAQRNGVFDENLCTRLTGRDKKTGERAVELFSDGTVNGVIVYDKTGKHVIDLYSGKTQTRVDILDKTGELIVALVSSEAGNHVTVCDKTGSPKRQSPVQ